MMITEILIAVAAVFAVAGTIAWQIVRRRRGARARKDGRAPVSGCGGCCGSCPYGSGCAASQDAQSDEPHSDES